MNKTPLSSGLIAALALGVAVLGGGCASRYNVQVDAIARSLPAGGNFESYRIQPRDPRADHDRLRFQETAGHIKTALSSRGLHEAPVGTEPDLIVEIDYGVEAPRVRYETDVEPVYASAQRREPGLDESGDVHVRRAAIAQPPPRQVVGHQEVTRKVVVREKHLSVSGRENKPANEGRPPNEIFHVHVSIENESPDLRAHLPILASAAMEKLGQTTPGVVHATVRDDDDAVAFIKRGL